MIKTITFAIMHFSVAFSVTYSITGNFIVGGVIALVEPAINTLAFYFHERIWDRLKANEDTKMHLSGSLRSTFESYALKS